MAKDEFPFKDEAAGIDDEAQFTIDIWEYVAIVQRRWLIMLLTLIVVVTAAAIWTVRRPKIYQAKTTIILKAETVKPLGRQVEGVENQWSYYFYSKDYRNTQLAVITSQPVLKRVVEAEELHLATDYDFLGLAKLPPEKLEEAAKLINPEMILASRISVDLGVDSELAVIKVKDADPKRAELIAKHVVTAYNAHREETMKAKIGVATEWLDQQAVDLREKLQEAESGMNTFLQKNRIQATSFDEYLKLVTMRQNQLNQELIRAKHKQWQADSELKSFDQYKDKEITELLAAPVVESNVYLKELVKTVTLREQEFAHIASQLGPKHPKYKSSQAQLANVRSILKDELQRLHERAKNHKRETDRVVQSVAGELATVRREAVRLKDLSNEFKKRDFEIKNLRDLYSLVLKRSKETQVSSASQFQRVEVVEPATAFPKPIYPKTHLNILISILLGLVLAVGVALLLENIDTKISGREEAERLIGRPFLGSISEVSMDMKQVEEKLGGLPAEKQNEFKALDERGKVEFFPLYFTKSNISESIRLMRTNLLFMGKDRQFSTILVSSAHPKEGKSTVINYLAISLAALGKKVVLVDTDLHKPMVQRIYKVPNTKGVSSYLVGQRTMDDIVQTSQVDNLSLVTSGPLPPNSAELLATARFEELINELQQRFDYVLLDSPPILALSDALTISRLVHGILLVVQPDLTDRNALKTTVRTLHDIKAPLDGFVFNRIEARKAGYGKGGYYSQYDRYYEYGYGYYSSHAEGDDSTSGKDS